MDDATTTFTKPNATSNESRWGNVSIRAWLALMMTATICTLVIMGKPVDNNFALQWGTVIGIYFGMREKPTDKRGAA